MCPNEWTTQFSSFLFFLSFFFLFFFKATAIRTLSLPPWWLCGCFSLAQQANCSWFQVSGYKLASTMGKYQLRIHWPHTGDILSFKTIFSSDCQFLQNILLDGFINPLVLKWLVFWENFSSLSRSTNCHHYLAEASMFFKETWLLNSYDEEDVLIF